MNLSSLNVLKKIHKKVTSKLDNKSYWTQHNVTLHQQFASRENSLDYFNWRNDQYYNYIHAMPCSGFDGKSILDFGCGPGNDVVGFLECSKPSKVFAVDVSEASVVEAKNRIKNHPNNEVVQFFIKENNDFTIPLADNSVDYIHSSGVLHHIENPLPILKEFKRILKNDGFGRVMLYHYNSLWVHLYVPYMRQIVQNIDTDLSLEQAFQKSTDGVNCPYSRFYKEEEVINLFKDADLKIQFRDSAISMHELSLLPKRYDAIQSLQLNKIHRSFLLNLKFDSHGIPIYNDQIAGIDAVYEFKK